MFIHFSAKGAYTAAHLVRENSVTKWLWLFRTRMSRDLISGILFGVEHDLLTDDVSLETFNFRNKSCFASLRWRLSSPRRKWLDITCDRLRALALQALYGFFGWDSSIAFVAITPEVLNTIWWDTKSELFKGSTAQEMVLTTTFPNVKGTLQQFRTYLDYLIFYKSTNSAWGMEPEKV